MANDVYMHGQVLGTHCFRLRGGFLQPDEYSEIEEKTFLPGGETGTAATVLASLGVSCRVDGTHIGTEVAPMLRAFYRDKTVDLSSLTFDTAWPGLMDYVVVAGLVRSPMGFFQQLYEKGEIRWNMPKEADVAACRVAAIDPFFQDATQAAAEMCVRLGKPYVTIDCPHDTYLHSHAAINVVSRECTAVHYRGQSPEEILRQLTATTAGLVIITAGDQDMLWGRRGEPPHRTAPFRVDVRSTLGAGDTFKAGCVYGLLQGMKDADIVRFASACSAIAVSRFPLPLHPPRLDEVMALLKGS
ncbi:MAG: carbohydrate kinase family protein [bacterium]|nr:carbohydrate kinase family protein [bacterium]